MADQIILPAPGKGLALPVSAPAVGGKVLIVDATGKAIAVPVVPVVVGDKVTLINTPGKTIAIKGGTGVGVDLSIDPCKELTAIINPSDPSYIIVTWVPGDNNDYIGYEISTTGFSLHHNDGDIVSQRTATDLTAEEHRLKYACWHYVTIWGMRNGRYSKVALYARVFVPLAGLLEELKCYISVPVTSLPAAAGTPFYIIYGYSGNEYMSEEVATVIFSWSGDGGIYLSASETELVGVFVDDDIIFTQEMGLHSGEHIGGGRRAHTESTDITSICQEGMNIIKIVVETYWATRFSYSNEDGTTGTQPYLIQYPGGGGVAPPGASWWLYGDSGQPPLELYGSGVHISTSMYESPPRNPQAQYTVWFHDGGGYNSHIDIRLLDQDNGILEIWAATTQTGLKRELYAGNINLCGNVHTLPGLTYHGFLPISMILSI